MKQEEHYSGENSKPFWDKINTLKGSEHEIMYSMGVRLQNIEGTVLTELKACCKAQQPSPIDKATEEILFFKENHDSCFGNEDGIREILEKHFPKAERGE